MAAHLYDRRRSRIEISAPTKSRHSSASNFAAIPVEFYEITEHHCDVAALTAGLRGGRLGHPGVEGGVDARTGEGTSPLTWGRSGQGGRIRVTSADLQYLFGIRGLSPIA